MQFGENPNKVKNIVTDKNAEAFRLMYRHSCDKLQHLLRLEDDTVVQVPCGVEYIRAVCGVCLHLLINCGASQDTSRAARQDLLLRLPARLKANVERQTGQSLVDLSGAPVQTIASAVASGISTLVKSSSRSQSLKGAFGWPVLQLTWVSLLTDHRVMCWRGASIGRHTYSWSGQNDRLQRQQDRQDAKRNQVDLGGTFHAYQTLLFPRPLGQRTKHKTRETQAKHNTPHSRHAEVSVQVIPLQVHIEGGSLTTCSLQVLLL